MAAQGFPPRRRHPCSTRRTEWRRSRHLPLGSNLFLPRELSAAPVMPVGRRRWAAFVKSPGCLRSLAGPAVHPYHPLTAPERRWRGRRIAFLGGGFLTDHIRRDRAGHHLTPFAIAKERNDHAERFSISTRTRSPEQSRIADLAGHRFCSAKTASTLCPILSNNALATCQDRGISSSSPAVAGDHGVAGGGCSTLDR